MEQSSDLAALQARIRKLEIQGRVWRWFVILALILLAAFPLVWFSMEQSELESRSYVLLDSTGKHRASLATSADGSPSLVFYDKEGKILALLNTKSDGTSGFSLYNSSGQMLFKVP